MKQIKWFNLAFSVYILTTACVANAEWLEIDNTYQDEFTYIDQSRIIREGDKVYYWILSTYKTPHLVNGKPAMSLLNKNIVDCKQELFATLYFIWYEGSNGTGNSINFMNVAEVDAKPLPIVPNSIADHEAKIACNSTDLRK